LIGGFFKDDLKNQKKGKRTELIDIKATKPKRGNNNNKRKFWSILYSVYIVFIIISATAYFAEQSIRTRSDDDLDYYLTFTKDGQIEHYDVKLVEKNEHGKIRVTYDPDKHHLDIKTTNILELSIDCRSMAMEKSKEVLGFDYEGNENEFKQYFINKNLLTMSIETDHRISLTLFDIPYPSRVLINGVDKDFTYSDGKVITTVPEGSTSVDIYFSNTGLNLIAYFVTDSDHFYHIPDVEVKFDASGSSPEDQIVDYLWDFGDGYFGDGAKVRHTYTEPGEYKVVLVLRDAYGRIARTYGMMYVFDEDNDALPDEWEEDFLYDLEQSYDDDPDNDKLNNILEYQYNTNPLKADTDGDGYSDKDEIDEGTDPNEPASVPVEKEEAKDTGLDSVTTILIALIIVIIIILVLGIMIRRSKAGKLETEEEDEERLPAVPEEYDEEEGEEIYTCPECGSTIEEDQKMCFECGAVLEWEEEEEEFEGEEIQSRSVDREGARKPSAPEDLAFIDDSLPRTLAEKPAHYKAIGIDTEIGDRFETEDEIDIEDTDEYGTEDFSEPEFAGGELDHGEYECPTCGAAVTEDDMVCPVCGEEFE
jgi:rubrerythrin